MAATCHVLCARGSEVVGLDRPRVSGDSIPAPLQLHSALAREPSVRELSEKKGGRGREKGTVRERECGKEREVGEREGEKDEGERNS